MFCPHCGNEVADGQIFCQHCGAQLSGEPAPGAAPERTAAAGGRGKTPWEDREALGFFGGLFKTLNETLFRPSEFFKKMSVSGGLTDPLLFALIVGMVGLMFYYLWQILLKSAIQNMIPAAGQHLFQGIGLAILAFLSPFLIILGLFVSSAILHVCLMMVKGAKNGFEATFRVVAYGYSTYIFLLIPACGGLLYAVWAIVLCIIGLREAHETTGGKAAFAVFLPLIVCCGLFMIAMGALFMGAVASLSALSQMQK